MKNSSLIDNTSPVYYLTEATKVTYKNISDSLKSKFNQMTIKKILAWEDDYYDEIGLNVYEDALLSDSAEPITVDEEQMCQFIIKKAAENNLVIEEQELEEILRAELIYLKQIGAVNTENL